MAAKIYCICNQKGGCAKTLTSVSLGIGLARKGKRVLLVDMDAQGSLTASLGYPQPDEMRNTLSDILGGIISDGTVPEGDFILHHEEGVDFIPANIELSGMEVTLVNTMSRETVLREYLKTVRDGYDAIMVDSNLQRENLLPSEKAWAYRMKLEALNQKGGRPAKDNCGQVVHNFRGKKSLEIVAEDTGENYKQVQRYIRLTELTPAMLQMVDDKKLPFNPAVELSYLAGDEQEQLKEIMEKLNTVPSLDQAKRLKEYSRDGKLTPEVMDAVLTEGKPAAVNVTIKNVKLREFFPAEYTQEQMEDVIFSLLGAWKQEHDIA